jgi:ABC-type nitrate/sulfonate/bicarbonate transport system substrate-binding protein
MMAAMSTTSRRRFLQLSSWAVCGAALAACGAAAPRQASPAASSGATKPSGSASAKAGPRTLTVTSTVVAGSQSPIWMADALHAFSDRGLNVTLKTIAGDIATKALVAGETDVLLQSAAPIITADLNGGTDLVYVGGIFNHSQFALNVAPSVKSAADLKGKPIGSDRPGTTGEYQSKLLLAQLGLQPSDVSLLALGSAEIQLPALFSGQIVAATIGQPQTFQAEAKGYRALANTYKIPYQSIGPVISKGRMDELGPALVQFMDGVRAGIRAYNSQPDLAKKLLQERTKETDPDILQKTYDFYKTEAPFQEDLQPTLEGIKTIMDFLAGTTLPAAKSARPEQFVDTRLLAQLPKA